MPAKRLSMRKTLEILRLHHELKRKHREIAGSCKISSSTVSDCLQRFKVSGLSWPLPEGTLQEELEARLYRLTPCDSPVRPVPDWEYVLRELRRKDAHVTLGLLWEEYRAIHADGYEYSWFCQAYKQWSGQLEPIMRQRHRWGERTFLDYAGDTVTVVDPDRGEDREAQIFVGVLGASSYTFIEATWSQDLPSWVGSHLRMLDFFGGASQIWVPDNLRSGVSHACFYEPTINPTYHEVAKHYGVAVIPARKRKPRDKAKVENGVLIVERWVLAKLRDRVFHGLDALNLAIRQLQDELNREPFQKMPGCREELFCQHERQALRPLPVRPYESGLWGKGRVYLDYHVVVEGHHYSVPYALMKELVEFRISSHVVELFHNGVRVASHRRSDELGEYSTVLEHRPPNHRAVAQWSPEKVQKWAGLIGTDVGRMATAIMAAKEHPEQGVRAVLGLLKLREKYGRDRLQAACTVALGAGIWSLQSVRSILETSLDRTAPVALLRGAGNHENVRGAEYYAEAAAC